MSIPVASEGEKRNSSEGIVLLECATAASVRSLLILPSPPETVRSPRERTPPSHPPARPPSPQALSPVTLDSRRLRSPAPWQGERPAVMLSSSADQSVNCEGGSGTADS